MMPDRKTRGAYDLTLRHLAQYFPEDLASFCIGRNVREVEILSPDLPATERRADWLVKLTLGSQLILLLLEFQTEYSVEKMLAMLDYRVRVRMLYRLPVFSAILYLTDEGYPGRGRNVLEETVLGEQQLRFQFHEICLWELDARDLLETGTAGLIPLASLARGETTDEPLALAVEAAAKIEDNQKQTELLSAIAVLGNLKYSENRVFSFIRRRVMKESTIAQSFIEEGLEQGLEKGLEQGRLIGEIQVFQRFLNVPVITEPELRRKSLEELQNLVRVLESQFEKGR